MTPGAIDAMEAVWARRLDEALEAALADHRRALASAGKSSAEIEAELAAAAPWLANYREARRRDIRSIIVSGRYGLAPDLEAHNAG